MPPIGSAGIRGNDDDEKKEWLQKQQDDQAIVEDDLPPNWDDPDFVEEELGNDGFVWS